MTEEEMVGWHHRLNGHESESRSVMSDSLRPHELYSPWDFPSQNTGVGSLFLLQGIFPTQDQTQASHIASRLFAR